MPTQLPSSAPETLAALAGEGGFVSLAPRESAPAAPTERLLLRLGALEATAPETTEWVLEVEASLAEDGLLALEGEKPAGAEDLAALRNRLWPVFHVVAAASRSAPGRALELHEVHARSSLGDADPELGFLVLARRRTFALSPGTTTEKFDRNAAGWNGDPGSPAYPHFRWMRRLLAEIARPQPGERVLDAGCGAGWVGLEAARRGAQVASFDPSPAMVELLRSNARELGVAVEARVGFVEEPPFEERFDCVLNSGVLSFAPDPDRFLAALVERVEPGGRLVVGDLNPRSRGFALRRRTRPVLPARELNALARDEVEKRLEALGMRIRARRFYQNTRPFPELLHRTRSRVVGRAVLLLNQASFALDAALGSRGERWFDSWILVAGKPR